MKTLEELLDMESEAWMPEPGDTIVGTIIDVGSNDAGYGIYPILTVEREDGTVNSVHAFHTVLKSEVANRQPRAGDRVGIKYLGKVKTKGGKGEYEAYKVRWEIRHEPAPDWEAMAEDAEEERKYITKDAEQVAQQAEPGGAQDDDIPFSPTSGPHGY